MFNLKTVTWPFVP